jgi:hypothetical protein
VADLDLPSDDAALAAIARHALHDEELVVAAAANDLEDPADLERARTLVERCATCRELSADVISLRGAIRASGSAVERATTMTAPRDFRLTAADAARLRPGSPIKRVAARLGWRARVGIGVATFGRPLGAAMATFGIVGLLVGSLSLGGTPFAAMSGGDTAASAAPGVGQAGEEQPEATSDRTAAGPSSTAKDAVLAGGPGSAGSSTTPDRALVAVASALLLLAGLALIVAARRRSPAISTERGN